MYAVVIISSLAGLSLLSSSLLYKATKNFVYSRKLAHFISGIAILLSLYLFTSPIFPFLLSLVFLVILSATHTREVFSGVQKRGRLSEVYFALSVSLCFLSWYVVDKHIGTAAALFLAWGDGITGLIRVFTVKTHSKDWRGSLGCFLVCALISVLLVSPIWIGIVGAAVGTLAERFSGDAERALVRIDDNLAMPLLSLAVMGALQVLV